MKYVIVILMMITNSLYGFVGFGVTGGISTINNSGGVSPIIISGPSEIEESIGDFTNDGFKGATSLGGYLYVDALPFVDIDFEVGLEIAPYKFSIKNQLAESQEDLPFVWASGYYYLTVQKKIIQVKVPLLAKAKLFGGLGVHNHTSTPMINQKMLESVMDGDIQNGTLDESKMIDYLDENKISNGGLHLQLGAQLKLFTFDTMLIYRYVFTDGITPDTNNFSNISLRFGLGF
jgi:hypothetical protein